MDKQPKGAGASWHAGRDRYGWHVVADGFRMAMPDGKAANLVAAAPKLLAALEGFLAALESMNASENPDLRSDVAAARAAIAKAKGEGR